LPDQRCQDGKDGSQYQMFGVTTFDAFDEEKRGPEEIGQKGF